MNEPRVMASACSYCGDAPVHHRLSFYESIVVCTLDAQGSKILKYVPKFIKKLVDFIPGFLFETLALLRMVKFSSDIERARTFRSKIIWEEAERRGIKMEQVIFLGEPLDFYRTKIQGKNFYFESIPIKPEFLDMRENWDDKVVLKKELKKNKIPVPEFFELPFFSFRNADERVTEIFSKLPKPVIVKPKVGSRGRHTITNIHTEAQLKEGIKISGEISSHLVVEEHLSGNVCRATLVGGKLVGFYRGQAPALVGDGEQTIRELIEEKDAKRHSRVEPVRISEELHQHIARSGFKIDDVLPKRAPLSLSHRIGRLFGGETREMLDELHPSFIPIFEKSARVVDLSVVGFDAIIPDPTREAGSQRFGIIECNSLPFIDLHYYALEGKPKNIAGMIWDLWDHPSTPPPQGGKGKNPLLFLKEECPKGEVVNGQQ